MVKEKRRFNRRLNQRPSRSRLPLIILGVFLFLSIICGALFSVDRFKGSTAPRPLSSKDDAVARKVTDASTTLSFLQERVINVLPFTKKAVLVAGITLTVICIALVVTLVLISQTGESEILEMDVEGQTDNYEQETIDDDKGHTKDQHDKELIDPIRDEDDKDLSTTAKAVIGTLCSLVVIVVGVVFYIRKSTKGQPQPNELIVLKDPLLTTPKDSLTSSSSNGHILTIPKGSTASSSNDHSLDIPKDLTTSSPKVPISTIPKVSTTSSSSNDHILTTSNGSSSSNDDDDDYANNILTIPKGSKTSFPKGSPSSLKFQLSIPPLGVGAFGAVYKAYPVGHPDQLFAVKKTSVLEDFNKEVNAMNAIGPHPNIVGGPYFSGQLGKYDKYYIFMEFCPNKTLSQFANKFHPLNDVRSLANIARDILSALRHIHSKGYVHKDIKLDNIAFDKNWFARVIDFGIAEPIEGPVKFEGSPLFAAPELWDEQPCVTDRSDIYSLGKTLFHLTKPYDCHADLGHPEHKVVFQSIKDWKWDLEFSPEPVDDRFMDFLKKCLAFDPKDRPDAETLLKHKFLNYADANPRKVPADQRIRLT